MGGKTSSLKFAFTSLLCAFVQQHGTDVSKTYSLKEGKLGEGSMSGGD
jgi:hypothetical protein